MLQSCKDKVVNEQRILPQKKRATLCEMQSLAFPSNWQVLKIEFRKDLGGRNLLQKPRNDWGSDIPWVTPGEISQLITFLYQRQNVKSPMLVWSIVL